MSDEAQPTFGVAEVLSTLWSDLQQAERDIQAGRRNPMAIASASVEIAFTVSRETSGGGGLSIRVFGVGAEGKLERTSGSGTVHRVTINLEPADDGGRIELPRDKGPLHSSLMKQRPKGASKRAPAKRATARRAPGKKSTSARKGRGRR